MGVNHVLQAQISAVLAKTWWSNSVGEGEEING